MKHRTPILGAAIAAAFIAAPAFAEVDFSSWDTDGDGSITLAEWDAHIEEEGIFDRLDENGNGIFDVEESDDNLFPYTLDWDVDDGGLIERQEFTLGTFERYAGEDAEAMDEAAFDDFAQAWNDSDLSRATAAADVEYDDDPV